MSGEEDAGGQNDTGSVVGEQTTDSTSEQTTVISDQGTDQVSTPDADGGTQAEDKGNDEGAGETVVPDEYQFNMPEGMELNASLAETAVPIFKELGLDQAGADKLTGLFAEYEQGRINESAKAFGEQLDAWAQELKDDKDFGGDNFKENSAIADQALEQFGSQELRDFLQVSGGCNHPAMVRFMWNVGKLLAEDGAPGGGSGDEGNEVPIEERMYPSEAKAAS